MRSLASTSTQRCGERLDAGVARADEDEGEMRRSGREVGGLELGEHVVAKRDRVGEVVEAESVLGEPRNGQRARDRAECEHQPLVAHLEGPGMRLDRDRARRLVEGGRGTHDKLRPRAHHPERDDDVAGLERRGGGLGEQRSEQHEVLRADDRRLPDVPRKDAAGIAAADDQRAVSGVALGHGVIVAAWPQSMCASSTSSVARPTRFAP